MTRSIKGNSLILVVFSILLAACAAAANQPGLAGTQWTLATLKGTPMDPNAPSITIQLDANGQVDGSAGCNSYGGSYTANNGTIQFSQIVSTLMACQDGIVMANESAYLQALNNVVLYQLQGDALILSGGDQNLVFNRK